MVCGERPNGGVELNGGLLEGLLLELLPCDKGFARRGQRMVNGGRVGAA